MLIEQEILQTDAVENTLALEVADAGNFQSARDRIQAEVAELDIEIARLVDLAASGSTAILDGLKDRERRKGELQAQAEHLDGRSRAALIDREPLRATIGDWRVKLSQNPVIARQVLAILLPEQLTFSASGAFCGTATFGGSFVFGGENRATRNLS